LLGYILKTILEQFNYLCLNSTILQMLDFEFVFRFALKLFFYYREN